MAGIFSRSRSEKFAAAACEPQAAAQSERVHRKSPRAVLPALMLQFKFV